MPIQTWNAKRQRPYASIRPSLLSGGRVAKVDTEPATSVVNKVRSAR